MTKPHDRLFRYVFSDPEQAAGEIRVLLPEEVSRQVDWGTLRLLSGTFVDELLDERRSDVLFRVELGGREALLYLLLEHQSTPDALMPFRLLRYMVPIWDGYLTEHPSAKVLPAVVPMVVHHSAEGWHAPTTFADVVDLDAASLAALRRHLPSFELLLDDLSTTRDEDLHARVLVPALPPMPEVVEPEPGCPAGATGRGGAGPAGSGGAERGGCALGGGKLSFAGPAHEPGEPWGLLSGPGPQNGDSIHDRSRHSESRRRSQGPRRRRSQGPRRGRAEGVGAPRSRAVGEPA